MKRFLCFMFTLLLCVFSGMASAEDVTTFSCGETVIDVTGMGYTTAFSVVTDEMQTYPSYKNGTAVGCVDLAHNFSPDAFPLFTNDRELVELFFEMTLALEKSGLTTNISYVDECAAIYATDDVKAGYCILRPDSLPFVTVQGENCRIIIGKILIDSNETW